MHCVQKPVTFYMAGVPAKDGEIFYASDSGN